MIPGLISKREDSMMRAMNGAAEMVSGTIAEGELASGLIGKGRMAEPEEIVTFVRDFFCKGKEFVGKRVLLTAGPTYERIDPVRFIGNYSSGKMGFAIAEAFASRGAEVVFHAVVEYGVRPRIV